VDRIAQDDHPARAPRADGGGDADTYDNQQASRKLGQLASVTEALERPGAPGRTSNPYSCRGPIDRGHPLEMGRSAGAD
jgi:hypothetical protein